jgi:hypothetical protein
MREEVAGDWRGLHEYKNFGGKLERKRPLGRRKRRGEDNIRMDLLEVGCEGVEWMHLAVVRDQWWALMNTVMNLAVQ